MENQTFTILSTIFGTALVSIIGLQVWLVKMVFDLDKKLAVNEEKHRSHERAIFENTQELGKVMQTLQTLHLRLKGVPVENFRRTEN